MKTEPTISTILIGVYNYVAVREPYKKLVASPKSDSASRGVKTINDCNVLVNKFLTKEDEDRLLKEALKLEKVERRRFISGFVKNTDASKDTTAEVVDALYVLYPALDGEQKMNLEQHAENGGNTNEQGYTKGTIAIMIALGMVGIFFVVTCAIAACKIGFKNFLIFSVAFLIAYDRFIRDVKRTGRSTWAVHLTFLLLGSFTLWVFAYG